MNYLLVYLSIGFLFFVFDFSKGPKSYFLYQIFLGALLWPIWLLVGMMGIVYHLGKEQVDE